jgi:hypothetical protein
MVNEPSLYTFYIHSIYNTYTILYNTIQYYTILYNTIQYYADTYTYTYT